MKIYFTASMHGSFEDKEWYFHIASFLKEYGPVLTEDISRVVSSDLGEKQKNVIIYERDTRWIEMADVVIAEVTTPSLEVGYEIGLAERLGKPILCLLRKSDHTVLSPIIAGNRHIMIRQYASIIEIESHLEYFFQHPRG
jgi:nucleoside 2-deoxyribosyltransferase